MRFSKLLIFLLIPASIFSQASDGSHLQEAVDSVLQEVMVSAFHSKLHWKEVPAAVAVISKKDIENSVNTSMVAVLNTVSGVRMEERSPASYRLSVRGSTLRSPFGVRNVKVYWNDIPLTDAGGNTYLNLVNLNMLSGAELVKGPAASMYGAGTGGALLLESSLPFSTTKKNLFATDFSAGSFGLLEENARWQHSDTSFAMSLQQSHSESDGYREQSASRKDIIKWQANRQFKNQQWQFLIFYADLFYQTPGGITLVQMQLDPKLSRQTAGAIPGAIQQHAAVYNKTIFGGLHHQILLNNHLTIKSFITGNHTNFTNPFITNYEKRGEANLGAGISVVYETQKNKNSFQWMNGAEWLYNHSLINDFGNRAGVADTVQFKDDITANQWFAFSQAQWNFNEKWNITAGVSLNNQLYRYKRLTDPNPVFVNKSIAMVVTPRLAVSYLINKEISLYTLAAKGFSPPALAEIRPSDGNYYGGLGAEYGWNFETGIKGELFSKHLQFDIAAYFFTLQNAIVRRNNAAGAEYFVNAGGAKQNGMEAMLRYQLIRNTGRRIASWNVWTSYSYQPYRFDNYQQTTINYSGNELTGVPRNNWICGMNLETSDHNYFSVTLNCTSSIPLTDANDVYAGAYQLLQLKTGFQPDSKNDRWTIFAGIDNLLNQVYSLGNDINAAGKRYYNPASGRSFFSGMKYRF